MVDQEETGSSFEAAAVAERSVDSGPLGELPKLTARQARLEARLARMNAADWVSSAFGWLGERLGSPVEVGRPEAVWRGAGLRRAGVTVQLGWPRLATRIGLGIDANIAHALVDRLLGFDRLDAESRLAVTPVEWGILSYVVAGTLSRLASGPPGPLGAWDLSVDRVGPDPFDGSGQGRVITIRWPVILGPTTGSLRLWLPEPFVARWLTFDSLPPGPAAGLAARLPGLVGVWKAEAGKVALPRGLRTLRVGGVLPLSESLLAGAPQNLGGSVVLTIDITGKSSRTTIPCVPVPLSGGARLTVLGLPRQAPSTRESIHVAGPQPSAPSSGDPGSAGATDVPVTLIVELGRVNLSLGRLADLKEGDVIELGRHSKAPIELTSGGRLVARGELVQIDTELGVRVLQVFL